MKNSSITDMANEKRKRLRRILASSSSIVTAPGCYDAITARMIERNGFAAAYMSGLCVAASLGYPDVGVTTAAEMIERAANIADNLGIPLIADADTGYGGASNVAATVQGFEKAGVAGIHLEDQFNPKKCAALDGKSLVDTSEMVARLRIAVDARKDADFVIIGRTDALPTEGLDASIKRARAYEESGADATMIMGVRTREEMVAITSALTRPSIVLMAEKLRPLVHPDILRDIGYPLVLYPLTTLSATVFAVRELLSCLAIEGTTETMLEKISPLSTINELLDLSSSVKREMLFTNLCQEQSNLGTKS